MKDKEVLLHVVNDESLHWVSYTTGIKRNSYMVSSDSIR